MQQRFLLKHLPFSYKHRILTLWGPNAGRTTSIYVKHKTLLKRCRITEERSTGEWIKEGGATGLEAPQLYFALYKVSLSPARAVNYVDSQRKWEKEPFLWEDTSLNLEKARPVRPEICTCGFTTMLTSHLRILYLTTTKCSCLQLKIWQLQISHWFFVDRAIMKNSKKSDDSGKDNDVNKTVKILMTILKRMNVTLGTWLGVVAASKEG